MLTEPSMAAVVTALVGIRVPIVPHLQLAMPALTAMDMASQQVQTGTMVVIASVRMGIPVWTVPFPLLVMPLNIAMPMV